MGTTAQKLTYLNETKSQLKDIINYALSDVPSEYTQVDYIESNKVPYIDTGIKADIGYSMEMVFAFNDTSAEQVNGIQWTNNAGFGFGVVPNLHSSKFTALLGHTSIYVGNLDTNKHYGKIRINSATSGTFTIDSESVDSVISYSTANANILLFARNNFNISMVDDKCDMKLYNCKIYNSGTLLRNYVPCIRNIDNKIGLYDLANNIFYTNQGTGNFVHGDKTDISENTTFRNYTKGLYKGYLKAIKDNSKALFNNMPKVPEQTGTESSLNDTADTRMKLELNPSELTQETTTGANLQKFTARTGGTSYSYKCDDKGQVTITGTVSSTTGLSYNLTSDYVSLTTGTYKMKVIGNANNVNFQTNNAKANLGEFNSNREATLTVTENITNFQIYQYPAINTTLNENYYITLARGTTATTERYTGGIPAPNPDYPQEVQVIKGNNSIKIENKNLALSNWASKFVTAVNNDERAKIETKDNRNCLWFIPQAGYGYYSTMNFTLDITFKENTQYTISFDVLKQTSSSRTIGIYYTDGTWTTNTIVTSIDTWEHQSMTSTAGKTIAYICPYYTTGNTYIDINTWQIEERTTATDYVAHQEQVLPLNLPVENLFDKSTATILNAYVSATGQWISSNNGENSVIMQVKPNTTYTISKLANNRTRIIGNSTSTFTFNNTYSLLLNLSSDNTGGTFTTGASDNYIAIFFRNAGASVTTQQMVDSMQIEPGDKANRYTPYGTTPIEYCKIGTYEDEFEHDGDKWYLNKYVGKVIFNGSESWSSLNTTNYWFRFRGTNVTTNASTYSNYFNTGSYQGVSSSYPSVGVSDGNWIYIRYNTQEILTQYGITDTASLQSWLSTHNTTVYYVLATPTRTEITDTTLISQLNAIEQAVSYDEQTNISQTNTGLPFIISASAVRSLANIFNLINE